MSDQCELHDGFYITPKERVVYRRESASEKRRRRYYQRRFVVISLGPDKAVMSRDRYRTRIMAMRRARRDARGRLHTVVVDTRENTKRGSDSPSSGRLSKPLTPGSTPELATAYNPDHQEDRNA